MSGTSINTSESTLRRSSTGASGTFSLVDGFAGSSACYAIAVSPINGAVFTATESNGQYLIRRSPSGLSGTFSTIGHVNYINTKDWNGNPYAQKVTIFASAVDNSVYVLTAMTGTIDGVSGKNGLGVYKSQSGFSGTFSSTFIPIQLEQFGDAVFNLTSGRLYVCGAKTLTGSNDWVVYRSGDINTNINSEFVLTRLNFCFS